MRARLVFRLDSVLVRGVPGLQGTDNANCQELKKFEYCAAKGFKCPKFHIASVDIGIT
jgi:hypothetical protein